MTTITNTKLNTTEQEVQESVVATADNTEELTMVQREGKMRYVSTDKIRYVWSLRLDGDTKEDKGNKKLKAFVESVKVESILAPLIVRKIEGSTEYTLIDGGKRLEAANILGIKKVPVIVYDENDNKAELLRIIANSNQKKATPIELAMAYKKLLDSGVYKSNRELATALGVSESTVGTKINNLKLDTRIIEDMMTEYGINDQKVLKTIRSIEKIDEEGTSDKQWNVYSHITLKELGRKEALEYINEQKGEVVSQRFVKLESDHQINVVIDTSGLDEESVSRIGELLAEIEELRKGSEL